MRPPEFWERPPGLAAALLSPVGALVAAAARWRQRAARRGRQVGPPVICVGNLVVGGAGKTPTVMALCERLRALGLTPHVLSRGYGGRIKDPHRVDPARDAAADVGDEPLLLAFRGPVWVGRDRAATAQLAERDGADVLVMDDGFQNPGLQKDLSIVVIDAAYGHGNGCVMPAGPLREGLEDGFARADAALLIGDPPPGRPWPYTPRGLTTLYARVAPQPTGLAIGGARVVAFAGIGRPQKFFDLLKSLGARLVAAEAFPDHHLYSEALLGRMDAQARAEGAMLVTTEKDAVRLPKRWRGVVATVPITLGFDNPSAVDALLAPLFAEP